jgi:mono/diheme cytochrome c family protein
MWLRVGSLALAAAVTGLAVFWIITIPAIIPGSALPAYSPDVGNGRMVFNAGGCSACHAAAGQDRTMLGGGLAIPSPFGTFYAPNISPDANDGIGGWSEADFVTALKRGTSPAGTHYFPAFPYGSYQHVGIEDIRDVFAYIKTLPPVPGRIRDHDLSFPFNVRRLVGGWKFLFLDHQPLSLDAARSPEWNRGAYLVNGLGHCAECHSPPQFSRRHCGLATICRWTEPGRRGMGTEHHAKGLAVLVGKGHRLFPCDR